MTGRRDNTITYQIKFGVPHPRGRRQLLAAAGATAFATTGRAQPVAAFGDSAFALALDAAEHLSGGRFGVGVLDTHSGRRYAHRGDERFPFASTFKCILAAATLDAAYRGRESLDRAVPITPADMVSHAPVTGPRVGATLSVAQLCEATMVWSDNPAANLLLPPLGGPAGLTAYARSLGDTEFRLDRFETAMSEGAPGDLRDTTTPLAMLGLMHRLILGDALAPASREQLTAWLVGCRTGDARIRAGLPSGWRCGDKTGSGGFGATNDIAILWPPGRRPILVAGYITGTTASAASRDAALAALGRAIATTIA